MLPLAAMWAATLLPERVRGAVNQATQAAPAEESYLNLLPQADEHDRAVFLGKYFGLENKEYLQRFLQMNRDITILQDYSAGSNATTMLCMDKQSTFYRKYAFGASWPSRSTGCAPSRIGCRCARSCALRGRMAAAGMT